MLDAAVLEGLDEAVWSKEWLLAGLLTSELIECVRYADEGPPVDAPQQDFGPMGERVIGWAVVDPEELGTGYRSVTWSLATSTTEGAVVGNGGEVAAADDRTDAYSELDPVQASRRRRSDALAAQVADVIGADLFITDRPYLHKMTWTLAEGVTYCHLDDSLTIIGLYLRAQGSFIISRDPAGRATHTMNRGLYYWVAARELLPSGWRWFSACVQHSIGTKDQSLLYLGQSVLQRVQRALQVRDDVHVELNKPQNNDTADQALSSLDVALLLLMGAVDATARVVHAVLGIGGGAHRAGWQRARWLAEVSGASPPFGALFQRGTEQSHTLTILRLLRNSIHGEALPALGVGQGQQRDGTLVGLPAEQQLELMAAIAALGGETTWGVEQRVAGRMHADPGVLLEALLPRVLKVLNEVMDATPVEQLPNVNLQPSDLQPATASDGSPSDPFDELNRQSIRWQLGL